MNFSTWYAQKHWQAVHVMSPAQQHPLCYQASIEKHTWDIPRTLYSGLNCGSNLLMPDMNCRSGPRNYACMRLMYQRARHSTTSSPGPRGQTAVLCNDTGNAFTRRSMVYSVVLHSIDTPSLRSQARRLR